MINFSTHVNNMVRTGAVSRGVAVGLLNFEFPATRTMSFFAILARKRRAISQC
jgi:hypothetical protein